MVFGFPFLERGSLLCKVFPVGTVRALSDPSETSKTITRGMSRKLCRKYLSGYYV